MLGGLDYHSIWVAVKRALSVWFGGYISVKDARFGAVGDNVANDLDALKAAVAYCATLVSGVGLANTYKPTLWFPPALGYRIVGQLAIPQNINVVMDGALIYAGAGGEVALDIGVDSATDVTRGGRYTIDVRRNAQSDWSSASDVGVRFRGVNSSKIWLRRADKFTIGAQLQATANYGCFFNRVTVGEIRECKYAINLASSNVAFANNNNQFHGGEHAVTTTVPGTVSRYGVWLSGSSAHNANEWFGPSFELDLAHAAPGVAVPFLIDKGSQNFAYAVRAEGCSTDIAVVNDTGAQLNYFEPSRDSRSGALRATTITDNSYAQTTTLNTGIRLLKQGATCVFDSGNLGWATNVYDGSTTYTVDGFDIGTSDFSQFIAQTSMKGHDRYLEFTAAARNLVRWIDTSKNKRFIVEFETETGSAAFTYGIVPFDATQTILADNPTPPHVYGEDASQLAWQAGEYTAVGAYAVTGAAVYTYAYFAVDALTKIAAFVVESVNGLKLRRVRIWAVDYDCSTWQVLRARGMNGKYIASAIPTVGSWTQGTRIWRDTATSGATDGWAVTTKGTLDAALVGVTATTTLNSTQVVVNDASNLEIGKYITIVGVSGVKRIVGVNGTTVVIDVKADAAVAGAAVAYSVGVLKLMANLS